MGQKPKEVNAVYAGDSRKFHIFQIEDDTGESVGSVYVSKEVELPNEIEVSLITPQRDKFLWETLLCKLISKARKGSKAEAKLQRTLGEFK